MSTLGQKFVDGLELNTVHPFKIGNLMYSQIEAMFDEWSGILHAQLSRSLDEKGQLLDSLSDAGYWKTMCMAAWAEKNFPNSVTDIAAQESLRCLWRETEESENEVTEDEGEDE